ncbi:hypothetical protein [Desulfovibrio subterraneus]|uniref:Uncharacterized protein n=1 Tax=Desulfovibrio subterraneus TaxID=2718620 RepID=A0A7J0BK52_9BACT|nr:hypothetical protein [Desulfovibrio subterraneus]GFM34019.1 hypothetical protein DSM101010T_23840 [Desulfovibrio subterraneus]
MNTRLFVDNNDIAYCTTFEDGRIYKVLIKPLNKTIYVCEECGSAWLDLDSLFTEEHATSLQYYLKEIGIIGDGYVKWSEIVEYGDFLTASELEDAIQRHGISIVN